MSHKKRRPTRRPKRRNLTREDKQVSIEQFVAGRQDEGELSEDEADELAWAMHPDLERLRQRGTLPDEMVDGDQVWSPRGHIIMHAVAERQIANNEPEGITALAIRFEREKQLSPHEIRHVIAAAVGEQLWHMQREGRPFDSQQHLREVERLYGEFVQAKS